MALLAASHPLLDLLAHTADNRVFLLPAALAHGHNVVASLGLYGSPWAAALLELLLYGTGYGIYRRWEAAGRAKHSAAALVKAALTAGSVHAVAPVQGAAYASAVGAEGMAEGPSVSVNDLDVVLDETAEAPESASGVSSLFCCWRRGKGFVSPLSTHCLPPATARLPEWTSTSDVLASSILLLYIIFLMCLLTPITLEAYVCAVLTFIFYVCVLFLTWVWVDAHPLSLYSGVSFEDEVYL
jgi:hypothetical protein